MAHPQTRRRAYLQSTLLCCLASAALFVVASPSAHSATLYLRWATESGSSVDLPAGGEATVEIWIDLLENEAVAGLGFANAPTSGLEQIGTELGSNGWQNGTVDGVLGSVFQWVQFSSPSPAFDLTGPGSFLLGTQTLHVVACAPDDTATVAIDHATVVLLKPSGAFFSWDARYNTTDPGYAAYGDFGNAGWGTSPNQGHQPTPNPLIIECAQPVPQSCTTLPATAEQLLASTNGLAMYTEASFRTSEGCPRPVMFYNAAMASGPTAAEAVDDWFATWGLPEADSNAFGVDGLDLRLLWSNPVGVDGAFTVSRISSI